MEGLRLPQHCPKKFSWALDNGADLSQITRPAPGDGEAQPVTTLGYDPTTGLLNAITDSDGTTST